MTTLGHVKPMQSQEENQVPLLIEYWKTRTHIVETFYIGHRHEDTLISLISMSSKTSRVNNLRSVASKERLRPSTTSHQRVSIRFTLGGITEAQIHQKVAHGFRRLQGYNTYYTCMHLFSQHFI